MNEFTRECLAVVDSINPIRINGHVTQVIGLVIESLGPSTSIGEICIINSKDSSHKPILTEVVGFKDEKVLLMPIGEMRGIAPGCEVIATGAPFKIDVGEHLLGSIIDGMGNPMDGSRKIETKEKYNIHNEPPNPLLRQRISKPFETGIKAIDSFITIGRGQRMGIFSGSGVGKSVLLGMIARYSSSDVNVIALIGERGREVREFIENDLGEEGLRRSIVVVATSDQPSLIRLNAAFVATSIAEYFRNQGKNVILMMDSLTRFCTAQREIGLTVGEPPTTKGYPPSVFALLPKLIERTGSSDKGTITALYAVLVDADDMNEPIADAARGFLDGHIVLSRDLAHQNHFPAIDVLQSISRVAKDIIDPEHFESSQHLKDLIATYREAKDLINIGAYVEKSNPKIDMAIAKIDSINTFLKQKIAESSSYQESVKTIISLSK